MSRGIISAIVVVVILVAGVIIWRLVSKEDVTSDSIDAGQETSPETTEASVIEGALDENASDAGSDGDGSVQVQIPQGFDLSQFEGLDTADIVTQIQNLVDAGILTQDDADAIIGQFEGN